MPVLVEGPPGEEAGSEGDTIDLRSSAIGSSPKGTNGKGPTIKTDQKPSALLTEQPTISDLQSFTNGNSPFLGEERIDTESKEEERQDSVASATIHTPIIVMERSALGSVPSQEITERKEKMQVLDSVAHQKSASMSFSTASTKSELLTPVKLSSPISNRLRRQIDRDKDIPRSLVFLTSEDKSDSKVPEEDDDNEDECTTYDDASVTAVTSFARCMSSESDILTSVSQLESVAFPQLEELAADDSSDELSQQISMAFSNWTDATDSTAYHDPRCCDAFLVPNHSMLEYPVDESRQTHQHHATAAFNRTESRVNPSTGDSCAFLLPIHALESMEV